MTAARPADLTSGRLLARNTVFNLAGEGVPFLVGMLAIPVLIRGMGVDRYGVLTLLTTVIGYFSLFDFGLGAAVTKFIAEAAAAGERKDIAGLFWTSLALMLVFGLCGALLAAVASPWLVDRMLQLPATLRGEARGAFYLLAAALPFVVSAGNLRGTLTAFQRFDLSNTVRVPMSIFSYVGPLFVLPFSHHLTSLVAVTVAGQLISWTASFLLCLRVVPELRQLVRPRRDTARAMLGFGGWLTVSSIVGPIMVYFDRFLIGAMLGPAAVAYYAVPYQLATKMWIIVGSAEGVLFAALSSTVKHNPARAALLVERMTHFILFGLFPPVLLIVVLAPEGLNLWLGHDFAQQSVAVMRWIAVGAFVNSFARTPYSLILSAHRPDLTARLHVAELPAYCLVLWWMLPAYGVTGAAITWTLRATVDAIVLFGMARRLLPQAKQAITRTAALASSALLLVAAGAALAGLSAKLLFLLTVLLLFAATGWHIVLDDAERGFVRRRLGMALVSETRK